MTRRLTKRDFNRLSEEYRLHNKKMKQSNNRRLCFSSFEVYLDWRFGRNTVSSSKTRTIKPVHSYTRSTRAQGIPSRLYQELPSDLRNATARPDGNSYSGTYITGLATMHKSNTTVVTKKTDPTIFTMMRR